MAELPPPSHERQAYTSEKMREAFDALKDDAQHRLDAPPASLGLLNAWKGLAAFVVSRQLGCSKEEAIERVEHAVAPRSNELPTASNAFDILVDATRD